MKSENLIEELKEIGFNEYKAKVFMVLSAGKIMSATEIAKASGIVRGSVYDVLRGFVQNGYCNEIETNRVLQYQIIDPDVILDKIIREYNTSHSSAVSKAKNVFKKLKENHSTENDSEAKYINIELIRGFNKHRVSKYKELLLTAEHQFCGMYKFKGLVSDEADEVAVNFLKKGGKIRSLYQIGLDFKIVKGKETIDATPGELVRICKKFEKTGEQIRLIEKDIPNMTIVDDDKVFINTEDKWIPRQSQADLIMRRSNFAKYMQDLFDYYWNDALTIDEFKKKEDDLIK